MKDQKDKPIDAINKTYLALEMARLESGKTNEQLAEQMGFSSKQSLGKSISNKTLRLETLYQLEDIFKKKIVYSKYDFPGDKMDKLLDKMESIESLLISRPLEQPTKKGKGT
jgi:hypothetical protein